MRYLRAVYLGLGLGGTVAVIVGIIFLAGLFKDWLSPDPGPRLQRFDPPSYEARPSPVGKDPRAPAPEILPCEQVVAQPVPSLDPGLNLDDGLTDTNSRAERRQDDWWRDLQERGLVAEGDALLLGLREIDSAPWGATTAGTLDREGRYHLRVDPNPEPRMELGGERTLSAWAGQGSGGLRWDLEASAQLLRIGPLRLLARGGLEGREKDSGWKAQVGVGVKF